MSVPDRLEPTSGISIPAGALAIFAATRSINLLIFALLVALTAVSSAEGQDTHHSVRLFIRGPEIVVQILQPTKLSVVIDELCQRINTTCEGTEHASSFSVAAMEISGHWDGIVSKLLGGTQLNYISSTGTSQYPGKLIVYSASSGVPAPGRSAAINDIGSDQDQQPATQIGGNEEHALIQNSVVEPVGDPVMGSASIGSDSDHRSADRPSVYLGALITAAGEPQPDAQNENGSISHNPFTGATVIPASRQTGGSPISGVNPTSTERVLYLPIPDANGKLVAIPR